MKRICLLLILLLSAALLLFSGCGDRDAPGAPMTHPVSFYYRTAVTDFAAEDGVIRAELRDLNPGLSLKELFEIYFQGPEREDLTAPFAKDCSLSDVYRSGNRLEIRLTRSALSTAAFDHSLSYACIARTGLALEGVASVHIYVRTPGGAKADEITLTESSLLLYDGGLTGENTELTLYFSDETGELLVSEKRSLPLTDSRELPELVLDLLEQAPQSVGLRSALPPGARHLDVNVENGLCTVDFNADFFTNRPESEQGELLTLLSVVNSLCELKEVDRVKLFVAGSELSQYRWLDLSEPWIRDSTVVGPIRQELGEFAAVLCLPDPGGALHRVTIRCRARGGDTRETALLQALFTRTERNGLTAPFADRPVPLSVRTERGVCTVELAANTLPAEEPARSRAIRSVSATLAAMPEIRTVVLLEGGQRIDDRLLVPEPSWFCTDAAGR